MLLSKATELTFADGTDYRSLTAVACDNGNKHDCSREVVTAVGSGGEGGGGVICSYSAYTQMLLP